MYMQQLDMHVNFFLHDFSRFYCIHFHVYNYYHGNDCGKNNGFELIT
jgi:hypothetical protein